MEFYPESKVILTIRDPECWYESVKETIYQSNLEANLFPVNILYKIFGMTRFSNMVQNVMRKDRNRLNNGNFVFFSLEIFYSNLNVWEYFDVSAIYGNTGCGKRGVQNWKDF